MNTSQQGKILVRDAQVCALRELVLARQALRRAADEFTASVGVSELTDAKVDALDDILAECEPQEVSGTTLAEVFDALEIQA